MASAFFDDGGVNPPGKHFRPHGLPNRERAPLRLCDRRNHWRLDWDDQLDGVLAAHRW
jgi:hypothetical protein